MCGGLGGSWTLAQSMGIYPCNKLLLGLGSEDHIKSCLFPGCGGSVTPVIFANVTAKASGPEAFTQVILIKVRKDEFSGARICSPLSSPSCLRRLLTLAQPRASTGQASKTWRRQWCRGLSLEPVHDDQPALPQASLGTRGLESLWRKQTTGNSSPKALQTHLPVPSQFIAPRALPLHANGSFGGRQAGARSAVSG